jgi:AcrR family transcriptional regulator
MKNADEQLLSEQRRRILDAARSVFARKGLIATMDDIARAANVSHGLAYRYFQNKDAIIEALVNEALEAGPVDVILSEMPGSPEERLTAIVTKLIESRCRQPEIYLLLDQMRKSASPAKKLLKRLDERKDAFFDLLTSLILEGQALGTVRAGGADRLALAVGAVLEGLTAIALHDPQRFHQACPEPEMILRMLIPPAGSTKKAVEVKR